MAKKKPVPAYQRNVGQFDHGAFEAFLSSQPAPEAPAEQPSRGMARALADTGLAFGRGAVQGVRMLTDLGGADNAVSGGLRTAEEFIGSLRSAQAQQDERQVGEILKAAEGAGVLDQVLAGLKAFAVAPVATLAQAAGTSLPTLAAAAIPGVGPAAVAARVLGAGAIGGGQGAGAVKSAIYEDVKRAHLEANATPEEAEARAVAAQSYGSGNAGQIALGGALGVLAGTTGAERLVRGLTGGAAASRGVAARVLGGAVTEAIPEAIQGGQEKLATNLAVDRDGFPTDPMSGVIANATLEGVAGAGVGGLLGLPAPRAIEPPAPSPADAVRSEKVPERGPMTKALNAAVETAARKVEDEVAAIEPIDLATPDGEAAFRASQEAARQATIPSAPVTYPQESASTAVVDAGGSAADGMGAAPNASITESGVAEVDQLPQPDADPQRVPIPQATEAAAIAQREADRPPEPTGDVLPGDILSRGKPFKNMDNAMRALERAGGEATHELVRVTGGLVVRPKSSTPAAGVEPTADAQAPAPQPEVDATPSAPPVAEAPANNKPAAAELPMGQEPGGKARVVQVDGRDFTLSAEQAAEWDRIGKEFKGKFDNAKAQYETRRKQAPTDNPDMGLRSAKEQYDAEVKGLGFKLSAERRRIVGAQTPKEQAKATEDAARIRPGDRVRTPDGDGEVTGQAFGKVRVNVGGTSAVFPRGQVEKMPLGEAPSNTEASPAPEAVTRQIPEAATAAQDAAAEPSPPRRREPAVVVDNGATNPGEYIVRDGGTNLARFEIGASGKPVRVRFFFDSQQTRDHALESISAFAGDRSSGARPDASTLNPETPDRPARTPEEAKTIELRKRLSVLESLRRCVG